MAVRNLGRTLQSSIEVTITGNPPKRIQTYTQEWLVRLDDPCTEEAYVGSAPGLPIVGQQSPELPSFYCLSRSFKESTDVPGLYNVTITWSTDMSKFKATGTGSPQSGGGGGNDNYSPEDDSDKQPKDPNADLSPETPPWERPARWSMATTYMKTLATYSIFCGINADGETGNGIFPADSWPWTSAGDYITRGRDGINYKWLRVENSASEDVFIDKETAQLEYNASFACRRGDVARCTQPFLLNSINSVGVIIPCDGSGYFPGQVWYKSLSMSTDFFENDEFSEVFYNIDMTFATNTNPGGWRTGIADIGGKYYEGGLKWDTDFTEFKIQSDENGNPVKVKLNGFGDKASPTDRPATIWWSTKQFADLTKVIRSPELIWNKP